MRRRFRSSGFGLDEVFVGFIEFIEFIELWFGRVPGCGCLGALFLCGGGWQPVHQTVLGIGGVWVVWIMWFDGGLWAISAALDGCKG